MRQRVILALTSSVFVFCLLAASFVAYAYNRLNSRTTFAVKSLTPLSNSQANFLLVGVDSATGIDKTNPITNDRTDSANTDTIMVLHLDQVTGRGSLLSIPRDLYVPIAGTPYTDRINVARGLTNGRDALVRTIKSALNIDINHYVEVDFKGFLGIVNAVDGVPFYFAKPSRDANTGLDVGRGCLTLNGTMALALVRSRHLEEQSADGSWVKDLSSDFGRVKRQQQFIRSLTKRALSKASGNPFTALQLLNSTLATVGTSQTLSNDDLLSLAKRFKNLGPSSLDTYSLPTDPMTTSSGQQVLSLKTTEAQTVLSIFRGTSANQQGAAGNSSATVARATVRVKVLNGSGTAGLAKRSGDALAALGFVITGTDNASSSNYQTTKVLFAPGKDQQAKAVADAFAQPVAIVADSSLDGSSIVVVIGKDLPTILTSGSAATNAASTTAKPSTSAATQTTAPDPAASCA